MRRFARTVAIVGSLAAAGCVVHAGPQPDSYEAAKRASGVEASLATRSESVKGELLDLRMSDLVILTKDRVVSVPISAITLGVFDGSPLTIVNGQLPGYTERETIRLMSRYPQGIPDVALKRLLTSKAQDSVVVIR